MSIVITIRVALTYVMVNLSMVIYTTLSPSHETGRLYKNLHFSKNFFENFCFKKRNAHLKTHENYFLGTHFGHKSRSYPRNKNFFHSRHFILKLKQSENKCNQFRPVDFFSWKNLSTSEEMLSSQGSWTCLGQWLSHKQDLEGAICHVENVQIHQKKKISQNQLNSNH